jgi:serine/threonine protein kinase
MGTASRICATCDTPVPKDAAFCPACGAATPTDLNVTFGEGFEDRLEASLADRYHIVRELGQGGMAVVFLARDLKHDRNVALKVMRPELAASIGTERFLREIQIAAKLSHPHILGVHDSGEADGFLYYVMPYVEGVSLRGRMNRDGQLPIEESLRIAREVAAALHYAHSLDIVHRDIKPENILLHHGEAVVADFGIARAVSAAGGERLTETGIAVGTPLYMSPEQATGEPRLDGRSDIYSLGCVLYEMLAGEPPYAAPTAQAIVAKKLSETTPHISLVRELVPEAVDQALVRALAKARADRFTTAEQFAVTLHGIGAIARSDPGAEVTSGSVAVGGLPLFRSSSWPSCFHWCAATTAPCWMHSALSWGSSRIRPVIRPSSGWEVWPCTRSRRAWLAREWWASFPPQPQRKRRGSCRRRSKRAEWWIPSAPSPIRPAPAW